MINNFSVFTGDIYVPLGKVINQIFKLLMSIWSNIYLSTFSIICFPSMSIFFLMLLGFFSCVDVLWLIDTCWIIYLQRLRSYLADSLFYIFFQLILLLVFHISEFYALYQYNQFGFKRDKLFYLKRYFKTA